MTWPLETAGLRAFAQGRRAAAGGRGEALLRGGADPLRAVQPAADQRPAVLGKTGLDDAPLLPAVMELSPELLARALARVLPAFGIAAARPTMAEAPERPDGLLGRAPTFCAGCPHNTSTRLPDGSFAMAGIGCHVMAMQNTPGTGLFSVMGGEGVAWTGLAPFTSMPHVFANMGDGTYQHSGLLAIRQSVAAKTRITYKILYNDAVAMTGGQPTEGGPTVIDIARQICGRERRPHLPRRRRPGAPARGQRAAARRDPPRPRDAAAGAGGVRGVRGRVRHHLRPGLRHREAPPPQARQDGRGRREGQHQPARVRELRRLHRAVPLHRHRADRHRVRPQAPHLAHQLQHGPVLPEGVLPLLRHLGHRRAEARRRGRWQAREAELAAGLPDPVLPDLATPWRGLFAGIGGGGIVTAGAVVAMAASMEGKQVSTLDFTGLAQKNGAVVSHVQIAHDGLDVVRIPTGEADLMIAADLAVGAQKGVLERMRRGGAVLGNLDLQANTAFLPTGTW